MKALLLSAACAALLCACGGGGGELISSAQATTTAATVDRLRFILRPDPSGRWFIQHDVDHKSEGVNLQVEQGADYLRVFFAAGYTHAGVVHITSDDDFGSKVTGHGNLGLSSTTIRVEVNGQRIDPARIWDHIPVGGGNFWVSAEMVR